MEELGKQKKTQAGSKKKNEITSKKEKNEALADLVAGSKLDLENGVQVKEVQPKNDSVTDDTPQTMTEAVSASLPADQEQAVCSDSHSQLLCQRWEDFLKAVEQRNSTLAALLRSSQPQAGENGEAQVKVFYRFHQEQLQQPKFRTIIEECGQTIVGDKILFKFVLMSPPSEAEVVDLPAQTQSLEALAEEVLM